MNPPAGASSPPAQATPRLDVPGTGGLPGRLFPPLPTDVEWGLDRIRALLAERGDPHRDYPSLHVGGTNGKGSVAAVWAAILRACGFRVGLYTSPHLCAFTERFQVDGRPVDEERLVEVAGELGDGVVEHGLTFFEASTVLAFEIFRREAVEVAVVEVGLGGRLDATNVVRPEVTAVTNVALDHADYLGDTVEEIAVEKAGIAEEGVPLITGESDPAIRRILQDEADRVGAPFHAFDASAELADLETSLDGSRFTQRTDSWGELTLRTPLVGRHQAGNVALAVRALELVEPPLRPSRDAVLQGSAGVRWPGRLQVERIEGRTWLLDVAHNVAGMEALAGAVDELDLPGPRVALVGILGDKDWGAMLPPLFARVDRAVLTDPPAVPPHRRWNPEEAAGSLEDPPPLEIVPDFDGAVERARAAAGPGGSIVVTGSHYTVGGALRSLGRLPFRDAA